MASDAALTAIPKSLTGIPGLDEMTHGGLPAGRPTLVCGSAGCGKTLMGMQFLVRGALEYDEPGVFIAFEETATELSANVASLNWDLDALQRDRRLAIDFVQVEPAQIEEAGSYGLDGLFIRLGAAIDTVGAKRVVIDSLEVLFSALQDQDNLRSELRRLFSWLKERGVTAVITAERGDGTLTRHGLEEYVSDCVILLDHRVENEVSTRRLRVVKYRGSSHSADETPFMIDGSGFRVMPIGSMRLEHNASLERVSTGVPRLDTMMGGDGYFRGGSVLISGTPGSGKTTLGASFLAAGCASGQRGLLFAFEESPAQLTRNLRSVGIDLQPHVDAGLLRIQSTRPSAHGLEAHLAMILQQIDDFDPHLVVVDPISAFSDLASNRQSMLLRLIDLLKDRGITAVCTTLTIGEDDASDVGVSSIIDAWISLAAIERNGERNRSIRVIKARGTSHSNQVREFVISSEGVSIIDVYSGAGSVVMGTARQVAEAQQAEDDLRRSENIEAIRRRLERQRSSIEAQISALQLQLESDTEALELEARAESRAQRRREADTEAIKVSRRADSSGER
jgi:circadian clock protein KaiC